MNDGSIRKGVCLSAILLALTCVVTESAAKFDAFLQNAALQEASMSVACGQSVRNPYGKIDLKESVIPSVFRELTALELHDVQRYLYSHPDLFLTPMGQGTIKSNSILYIELYLPPKYAVLQYLDHGIIKPAREARVVIYRGSQPTPDTVELVVGPIPNPNYVRKIPYRGKPITTNYAPKSILGLTVSNKLKEYIDWVAGRMLMELYGATMTNCGNKCISFIFKTDVSGVSSGKRVRLAWYWLSQFVEFPILHPIDFSILVETYGDEYKIHRVYLNGKFFDTLPQSVYYYFHDKGNFTHVPFPVGNCDLFSTLCKRKTAQPNVPLLNPTQVSPEGKRYNVIDRHVSYMNWDFDVNMALVNGPQIFDVRFKKERIIYELSVQEVAALYSGSKPHEQLDLFDSHVLLGYSSSYLVPGVDCPRDATFLSASFLLDGKSTPTINKHAICVFELNTGLPLRRHHTLPDHMVEGFYEGMETVILVVRSILTITNYDYFLDFHFYANGAVEVKSIATGYITGSFYRPGEDQYGFRLQDHLRGPLHHHLFHFKVDMDIKGTKNRYRTSEIHLDAVPNFSKIKDTMANKLVYQNRIVHKFHPFEGGASEQANIPNAKYLVVTNEYAKDKYGNSAGYRIYNRRPTELIRPFASRNEAALSWARYAVAITKQKDWERRSSSQYAQVDEENPVVNFQTYVEDDESIIDEDLVAWITLGLQHIPHTEDLPVTHTPGMDCSFILSPYNYFCEDPAMESTNTVRIDHSKFKKALHITRYDINPAITCSPVPDMLQFIVKRDICYIFAC